MTVIMPKADYLDACNAIREKGGASGKIKSGAMGPSIRAISGGVDIDVPDYVREESARVVSGHLSKRGTNFLTAAFIADMHEMGDNDHSDANIIERYRRANLNAGQALSLITDSISPDFIGILGDLGWLNHSATTTTDGVYSIVRARSYTANAESKVKSVVLPGNHDVKNVDGFLDPAVVEGLTGHYQFFDISSKKVRVICLNTADNSVTDQTEGVSDTQLQWFASALDLSGKSDASSWRTVILSHHPVDWGSVKTVADCLGAYRNGATCSQSGVSYNFAGKNSAKVVANIHGHTHWFKYAKVKTSTGTEIDVYRVAVPNACFGRNNEYGQGGNMEFGEETTYDKTDNSAKNTSLCLLSIDFDKELIYADCYGAGYDRVISYGDGEVVTTYSVTNNLSNASTSNGTASVVSGAEYKATITPNSGYKLNTVKVTMGSADITNTAYDGNGNINIPAVTGNIVITVTVVSDVVYNVTNLALTSEEQGSTAVYNGIGYKNNYRVTEDASIGFEKSASGYVVTGWIPYKWNASNVIYIRGASVTSADYVRFYGFTSKTAINTNTYAYGPNLSNFFNIEEIEAGYYKLTPLQSVNEVSYIRISLVGTGENLIITVNEEIVEEGSGGTGDDSSGTYTNLVPTSVGVDGTTVFNEVGYMNGVYASAPHYYADAECVTTGFIWLPSNVNTIYVKGATWDTSNSHCRIHVYSVLGDSSGLGYIATATELNHFTVEELGENYYKFTITQPAVKEHWYCMSFVGTGENLIVTHDEPIN